MPIGKDLLEFVEEVKRIAKWRAGSGILDNRFYHLLPFPELADR